MKAKILISCLLLGLLLADSLKHSPPPATTGFAAELDEIITRFVSGSF